MVARQRERIGPLSKRRESRYGAVAWHGRGIDRRCQGPTVLLPRQLGDSRDTLPDGCVIAAPFYDLESRRKGLCDRGSCPPVFVHFYRQRQYLIGLGHPRPGRCGSPGTLPALTCTIEHRLTAR